MGLAILRLGGLDFKPKMLTRDKVGHYIKGSIYQEDVTNVNIHAPNIRAPKYSQQVLTDLKGEIEQNAVTVGNFSNTLGNG